MTVKPLSEDDFNYPYKTDSEYDDGCDVTVVNRRRLEELIIELISRKIDISDNEVDIYSSYQDHNGYNRKINAVIDLTDVKELLGPLVERKPSVSDKRSVPK